MRGRDFIFDSVNLLYYHHLQKISLNRGISPTSHIFLKTFNSEFQDIEVWFTDQNRQPLEKEDRINLILVINKTSIEYNSIV